VLEAVLRLRVDDVAAVAVAGDTVSDLVAGTRAGAAIVAGVLTGAHDRAALAGAPHTHILTSIAELPALC
jgi:phosphoglycolate phosphatase-like HAD superfamily hydrolase